MATETAGLFFHLIRQEEHCYAVVTIDETQGQKLTREELLHASSQFREYLTKQDCRYTTFLYLLITADKESAQRLFTSDDCFWILRPDIGKLLVFEHWHSFYFPLREEIEALLSREQKKAAQSSANSSKKRAARRGRKNSGLFRQRLFSCTTILILINVLLFLVTDFSALFFQSDLLLDLGANSWKSFLYDHEYYRPLTSMFLHADIDHIFSNMLALLFIGGYLEQLTSGKRFCLIYFLTGLLAGCTSMVYNMLQNSSVPAIGASGAIFGLTGSLLVVVLLQRGPDNRIDMRGLIVSIILSLYSGFVSPQTDNAAHVGGFAAGILVTVFLYRRQIISYFK